MERSQLILALFDEAYERARGTDRISNNRFVE